ncbi:MAG: calcineurin, partial [Myxococcales bacterium]|nr:calcineurin [Myxococcales bacterium]
AAGGALYVLNGNHELMNAAGDLRYVTAGGHLDFADVPGVDPNDPRAQRVPPQARGRLLAFAPGGPYATRLAKRNVVQVVGDTVFVHGGVLPEHVRYGLDRINRETQAWLRGEGELPEKVVADDQSPVWTRRYSSAPGPEDCAVLDEALAAIPAKRMVVGHTVHTEGISSACDGKVWMIDVGMASYYGGHAEALEIAGDEVKALRPE